MKNDPLCIKEDVCDMAVCDGVADCSHAVLKTAVLAQQTNNSDYTAALFETIVKMSPSYIDNDGETVVSLTKERLNVALKAAQHCA